MRVPGAKLMFGAAVAGVAIAVCAGLAIARLLDGDALRAELDAQLEAALGAQVELGALERSLFPLPGARIASLRIARAPAVVLDATQARVTLAPLPLLVGRRVLRTLDVDGARVRAGDWTLERVALHARLGARRAEIDTRGEIAGLGRIEDGRLALAGADGDWSATAMLPELDLPALCARVGLPPLGAAAAGRLTAAGRGAGIARAALELDGVLAAGTDESLHVHGPVHATLALGGGVALDFDRAEVGVAGILLKPPGEPLRADARLEALRLRDLRIASPALRAGGAADLAARTLSLASGTLELSALASWQTPDWLPRSGRLEIRRAALEAVPLALEVEGELAVGGEPFDVRFQLDPRQLALDASARGARVGPLAETLWGRSDLSGRLYGRVQLSGPPDGSALAGSGELEWLEGELPGISLARSAGLDHVYDRETMEERPGLDRFESLGARFRIAGDEAHVDELTLIQPGAAALVRGPLSLRDGVASFTGQVRFDDPELTGPSLRPILRMAGRLDRLETHISEGRPEVAKMEAAMIQAIHRAEARQRERGDLDR